MKTTRKARLTPTPELPRKPYASEMPGAIPADENDPWPSPEVWRALGIYERTGLAFAQLAKRKERRAAEAAAQERAS